MSSSRTPRDEGDEREVQRLREWQMADGHDVENALQAAERMLGEADERHRHEENRTFTILSLIVGVGLSLAASLVVTVRSLSTLTFAVVPIVISVAILFALIRALLGQMRRRKNDFTLLLAAELASIVGESYVGIAEREHWSELRRQSTRLRLHAFPQYDPIRRRVSSGEW
ncbi:hypothetical protein [Nocardia sp. NPDC048505]|uniref:hypothetical protein n=1 Tax=unclassified Nocardia TaxID=2637762 RepID=UPI0033E5CF2E